MNAENLSTDELIDFIVKQIGGKLPTYDYNYRMFESCVLENIKLNGNIKGEESIDYHDTFREACISIIESYNKIN